MVSAVRLWLDVFAGVVTLPSAQTLAALGAAAILVGNIVALRQARLKLLIAYSTVAQIGYLFRCSARGRSRRRPDRQHGGRERRHAASDLPRHREGGDVHGRRDSSAYDARTRSHRRLARCGAGVADDLVAFALGGASLIGLPPSGGFSPSGCWYRRPSRPPVVVGARDARGGLLTSAYVFIVVVRAMAPASKDGPAGVRSPLSAGGRAGAGPVLVSARHGRLLPGGRGARIGRAIVPRIGWP